VASLCRVGSLPACPRPLVMPRFIFIHEWICSMD